jgi:hypothetical protein
MGYRVVSARAVGALPGEGSTEAQPAQFASIMDEYLALKTMSRIRARDVVEIEELYREFVFPDLPKREGRQEMLTGLLGTTVSEAIYIISCLHRALNAPGDICEFGVAQGATSRLLGYEILTSDRKLWLFDSFEGLPAPSEKDDLIDDIFGLGSMDRYKGTMRCSETEVMDKLAKIHFPPSRLKLMKGWVEDVLRGPDFPTAVAFAYVDFDFFEPIKAALEFLDRCTAVGGIVVVDDYGYFSSGVQLAVDEFRKKTTGRYRFDLPLACAGRFCILTKLEH